MSAGAAPAHDPASNPRMVEAMEFWAAVQDCLIEFHHFSRGAAAEKVMDFGRRLANLAAQTAREKRAAHREQSFEDMIYHEEPWYIACSLAENEIPLDGTNREEYERIMQNNHLA